MEEHLKLLGFKARDVVTGAEGVVETISFDLYGCVQAVLRSEVDEKGVIPDGRWFDLKRLIAISSDPVMTAPLFDVVPGGSEKPAAPSYPTR